MRCDDVTRELAAPSGRLDPSALAAHLAACPACAGAARLTRLWAASRPAPPPGTFASAWAGIERAADHAARPAMAPARPRTGRLVIRWVEVAVAAGLLVAALAWHPSATPGPGPGPRPAPVVMESKVNIDEGQIAVISVDRRDVVTFAPPQNPASDDVAPDFAALNEFEAMAAL